MLSALKMLKPVYRQVSWKPAIFRQKSRSLQLWEGSWSNNQSFILTDGIPFDMVHTVLVFSLYFSAIFLAFYLGTYLVFKVSEKCHLLLKFWNLSTDKSAESQLFFDRSLEEFGCCCLILRLEFDPKSWKIAENYICTLSLYSRSFFFKKPAGFAYCHHNSNRIKGSIWQ